MWTKIDMIPNFMEAGETLKLNNPQNTMKSVTVTMFQRRDFQCCEMVERQVWLGEGDLGRPVWTKNLNVKWYSEETSHFLQPGILYLIWGRLFSKGKSQTCTQSNLTPILPSPYSHSLHKDFVLFLRRCKKKREKLCVREFPEVACLPGSSKEPVLFIG